MPAKPWVLVCMLFLPLLLNMQSAYSSPSSIEQAVPAKWNTLNFGICISNASNAKYEQLFIRAIEEWKSAWPYFSYTLSHGQSCQINVNILKDSVEFQKKGHAGLTETSYYADMYIESATITIPTNIKAEVTQGYYCCREVVFEGSEKFFYETALHEFGHVLNLAHAVDNEQEPVDIMNAVGNEEAQHMISALSIKTLDKIYATSTQAKDHLISIKPSVTLQATIDKSSYVFYDKIKLSGKVSKIGGTGTVLLFSPSLDLLTFSSFAPEKDGSFNVNVNLETDEPGTWLLNVQYSGASQFIEFEVKEVPYKASAETDKTAYAVGDFVKVTGNVTIPGDSISITVINPNGITVMSLNSPISSDKKFKTEFTLKETKFTIEGTWTIRLAYADSATDIHFEVKKSAVSAAPPSPPSPPSPVEELPVEAKLNVKVQSKQIKDLIILRVRSMDDSTADVYGFKISIANMPLKASKGPKEWEKEASTDSVKFTTGTEPLRHGEKQFFILKIDAIKPVIQWEALGSEGKVMAEGSLTPLR